MNKNLIIDLFKGETSRIPIWFLRQAGRHIPEYFEIRRKEENFISFCLSENLIVQSTKLPLKYYDLDAAIIFSDILMIPWAMERKVRFCKNFGPTLEPMIPEETEIVKKVSIGSKLEPLKNSILILRKDLPKSISIINYKSLQGYAYHTDAFDLDKNGKVVDQKGKIINQRKYTAICYLNDVKKGGFTRFALLNIDIKPTLGKVLIFKNVLDNSNLPDKRTLHGGLPVIEGEKWLLTTWF